MHRITPYFMPLLLLLFACEQEIDGAMETDILFEIQKESTIQSALDCYNEMRTTTGENFTGTSCHICSSYSANPRDTLTIYGVAYFYDAQITAFDNLDYAISWSVMEGGATLMETSDPRVVQLIIPDQFDKIILRLHNESQTGLVVSENLIVRNASQSIQIGDPGEAGQVMYDKGQNIDDWRYLEATASFIGSVFAEERYKLEWGCLNQEIGVNGLAIGEGRSNAVAIVQFMDNFPDYQEDPNARCSPLSDGSVSALAVSTYANNGFLDWHLPSLEEAKVVVNNIGFLSEDPNEEEEFYIWTSSEVDAEHAYAIDLYSGEVSINAKNTNLPVIGVRYF